MNKITFIALLLMIMIGGSCQKREANVSPICMEKAKEILKKDEKSFFKGTISKGLLKDKSILIVLNQESGAETILDNSCTNLYYCCGYTCDCAAPEWKSDIKQTQTVLEIQ